MMKKGFIMNYKYPEIRDVLMILAKYVRDGNLLGNTKYLGHAVLTARDEKTSKLLSNFLNMNSVQHSVVQGALDTEIVFKFGQNEVFDTTVKEMETYNKSMMNIANRLSRAENYQASPSVAVLSGHESR